MAVGGPLYLCPGMFLVSLSPTNLVGLNKGGGASLPAMTPHDIYFYLLFMDLCSKKEKYAL